MYNINTYNNNNIYYNLTIHINFHYYIYIIPT